MKVFNDNEEIKKWMVLSFALHLAILFYFVFSPQSNQKKRTYYTPVYKANLVTVEKKQKSRVPPKAATPVEKKTKKIEKKPADVSSKKKVKDKARAISKAKAKKKVVRKEVNADAAIASIGEKLRAEREIEKIKESLLAEKESDLKSQESDALPVKKEEFARGSSNVPEAEYEKFIQTYRDIFAERVRSNWTLPDLKNFQGLEAIVVVRIGPSGELIRLFFEERSANGFYNNSVEMAIQKSAPFPPLPEEFRGGVEFGLRFINDEVLQ